MRPSREYDDDRDADATPDSEYMTLRKRTVMRTVLDLARRVAGGRYRVARGAINWAVYDFAQPGCAIFADESTFLRDEGRNVATISLELMIRMPDNLNGIDDDAMDDLHDHAAWVFSMLEEARDPTDSSVPVIARLDRGTDSCTEVSDAEFKTQGIVATATVEF